MLLVPRLPPLLTVTQRIEKLSMIGIVDRTCRPEKVSPMSDDDALLSQLCSQLSLEEKVLVLTGQDSWSTHPLPRIGLRSMVLSDGPAGVRGSVWDERSSSINFPSPTAVAASWDTEMVRRIGEGLGAEARRKGVDVVLAPTINLQRTPYGGRHFEAFSEDPYLTAQLATAYVRGIQSHGVGATVKHYVANDSETERFTVDVRIDERTLREVYLAAFESPVIDGHAWLVMSAYNSINGATASENALLETPLIDEWGFDGVVVSDWTAVRSLNSARFPQDLVMPGPNGPWGAALVAAVRNGEIDEAVVDKKVIRILRLAQRVGALSGAMPHVGERVPQSELRQLAREGAVAGAVLLSNTGLLPLAPPVSVAVIGEGARWARTQGGGSATVIPETAVSPLEGIVARWPDADVAWARGAVVDTGLTDYPIERMRTPDGHPGMTVTYLDSAGAMVATERREASRLVSFDAESLVVRSHELVLQLTLSVDPGDTNERVGIRGVCDYDVVADGRLVAQGQLRLAPTDDHATAILNPPFAIVDVPVTGDTVDLQVRLRPVEGGIPDALTLGLGSPPVSTDPDVLISEAVDVASGADVAIVVVSTSAEVESEGFDRTTLALPGRQDDLVRAISAANPRTIVVVNSGAPVLLPWVDDVGATLVSWFPGQEFGTALADVLSGDREPGGRLTMSWPAAESDVPVSTVVPTHGVLEYVEGIHVGGRAWLASGRRPAFPFGHGLGYTTWTLSELSAHLVDLTGDVAVSFVASNQGLRPGATVAQVYLERLSPSAIDRPQRWLAAFRRVTAQGEESSSVTVIVPARAFAIWDGRWTIEPGDYRVVLGTSITDISQSTEVHIP